MALVSDSSTPLGRLFKACRGPRGWKRVAKETGLEERTVRYYEAGRMPRLDKALILARYYGIELEELAEAAMGEPWVRRAPATELGAGVDQVDREAGELRREVDALGGDAPDEGDPPSDEDESQSDQGG